MKIFTYLCTIKLKQIKTMEKFYIDSHAGVKTWIDVEDGIVIKIDRDLNPKMSEEYVGKTISFLKSDFEKRMKPTWYCVHCYRWSTILNPLNNIKSRRTMAYQFHQSRMQDGISEKQSTGMLNAQLIEINKLQDALVAEFDELKETLKNVHNFKVSYNF